MLVVMKHGATSGQISDVVRAIEDMGYRARPMPGAQRTTVGLVGNDGRVEESRLSGLDGVLRIIHVSPPYKQVSREWWPEDTIVELDNGVRIGSEDVAVMAGPCSVESREQILETAHRVAAAGATVLRGGAFKPRTSPYSFQGLGEEGLQLLARAREETGLAIVTEALDADSMGLVAEYADIVQIGTRNMQNYSLLRAAGRAGKPVLLKRGMAATIKEWLLAAEYIVAEGESRVMLCERGVRNFDTHARNLFDLTAVVTIQELSHLPVVADPSHGTGARAKVGPMSRAAVATGADALILEVHPDPASAASDGQQSLDLDQFDALMVELHAIAEAIGRRIARAVVQTHG
ncbi:3-deoxy-7-phosphoheptulonate synthase [Candidatus Palauibacter sp.]|uniref:3-deoxy-7-phosphoheptulonate synthase n=1 Tax=Candidatus Palauibacter sp. TaxID=3101350 RepID=UPI003B011BE5